MTIDTREIMIKKLLRSESALLISLFLPFVFGSFAFAKINSSEYIRIICDQKFASVDQVPSEIVDQVNHLDSFLLSVESGKVFFYDEKNDTLTPRSQFRPGFRIIDSGFRESIFFMEVLVELTNPDGSPLVVPHIKNGRVIENVQLTNNIIHYQADLATMTYTTGIKGKRWKQGEGKCFNLPSV